MTEKAQQNPTSGGLRRSLGLNDAVVIGLGSMLGAGIFAALAPAAQAAGTGLLVALGVAAVIAYCNATSSAKLAVLYPASGGTYVYGRHRLGEFWGFLAGWVFVAGKGASCAAMALTVGEYVWPRHANELAVGTVVAVTTVNYFGAKKSALLTRLIVGFVTAVLIAVVVSTVTSGTASSAPLAVLPSLPLSGVLQAAGWLFFAFAGYARIATLGEEVRDPAWTIPRAIPVALGAALVIYLMVAVAALTALGPNRLAKSTAPLIDVVREGDARWLVPVVGLGAAIAALGSLLALVLGVSRTSFAMARGGHLPHVLAAVHPRYGVPHRADIAVGVAVALLAAFTDIRHAIGFSSFAVLTYYAVTNASALTLRRDEGRPAPVIPAVGLVGCLLLAFVMPASSVAAGLAASFLGVLYYLSTKAAARIRRPGGRLKR